MALSIAVTMAMPTGVLAAGPGSLEQMQTEEGIGLQPQEEDQISEDLESQESGGTEGEGSQQPGETPEAYEARTGYVLPEGWHYVLDENGFVVLMEDGSPAIEADQEPGNQVEE